MLFFIAARTSMQRSAACWRVLYDAKGSDMAHWLIKSEPSAYSWDQFVKEKKTSWTGVRNPQASANLSAMKVGELCFFYHSNEGKEIVGIAKVLKAAYPDPTDKAGKAVTVDVAPVEPVKHPVTLSEMKATPALANMALIRQSRLLVCRVSDAEWAAVCKMAGIEA